MTFIASPSVEYTVLFEVNNSTDFAFNQSINYSDCSLWDIFFVFFTSRFFSSVMASFPESAKDLHQSEKVFFDFVLLIGVPIMYFSPTSFSHKKSGHVMPNNFVIQSMKINVAF